MEKYLSNKIRVISFLLMIGIVILHSFNLKTNFIDGSVDVMIGYNSFIQNFFSKGVGTVAVPLFFMFSGFLFFKKIQTGKLREFIPKYKSRVKMLLMPYLVWSILGLLLIFSLQSISFSKSFFVNDLVRDYTVPEILDKIFLNPVPYQFWFIRDLMLFMLLSPILYLLVKRVGLLLLLVLLVLWAVGVDFCFCTNYALLFFVIGAYLRVKKINISKVSNKNYMLVFVIVYLGLITINTFLIHLSIENLLLARILLIGIVFSGIISVWIIYDKLYDHLGDWKYWIKPFLPFSFFLFAAHEPLLLIIKKGVFFMGGQTEMMSLINYFVAPICTIVICVGVGMFMNKYVTKLYKVLSGNR
jgi:surface polysaccharide O-acyltransferase-like enzyme